MFRELHQYTIDTLLARADARPLPVSPSFARREGILRGTPLVMTNVAYETRWLRKVRLTYMDAGEAAQIFTAMAFPRWETDLPIFGADVLAFRGAPHLIVIDHQPLFKTDPAYADRYIAPLADVHARFAHVPARERSLPAWTEEFFSPYTHYSRPPLDYLPDVLDAYRAYWDRYLDLVATVVPVEPTRQPLIHARQAAYCRNHTENEQAEGMLQKLFGVEWCETFVHDFLFDIHFIAERADA